MKRLGMRATTPLARSYSEGRIGPIRKVVVHDGHQGPKEIGVGPEFLSWLTDPEKNGAGSLIRLRLLWRESDDMADEQSAANERYSRDANDQAGYLQARRR